MSMEMIDNKQEMMTKDELIYNLAMQLQTVEQERQLLVQINQKLVEENNLYEASLKLALHIGETALDAAVPAPTEASLDAQPFSEVQLLEAVRTVRATKAKKAIAKTQRKAADERNIIQAATYPLHGALNEILGLYSEVKHLTETNKLYEGVLRKTLRTAESGMTTQSIAEAKLKDATVLANSYASGLVFAMEMAETNVDALIKARIELEENKNMVKQAASFLTKALAYDNDENSRTICN